MEKLKVEVKKICYKNESSKLFIFDGISVRKKINSTGKTVKTKVTENFSGKFFSLYEGDILEVEGDFAFVPGYGEQFKIEYYKKVIPNTVSTIEEYLCKHLKGMGETKAKALTEAYGENTLSIIAKNIRSLNVLPRCSEEKKREIYEHIRQNLEFERLIAFLQSSKLKSSYALRIYETFKEDSIKVIRKNPYCLFEKEIMSFKEAENVAYLLGFSGNEDRRLRYGIISFLLDDALNKGNIFTHLDKILARLNTFLSEDSVYKEITFEKEKIISEIGNLSHDRIIEYKREERIIYLTSLYETEKGLAGYINEKLKGGYQYLGTDEEIENAIEETAKKMCLVLHENQKVAIINALNNPISIITGGPGTGKTQVMAVLINVLKKLEPGIKISLCSPTGKAAKRMSELAGEKASTIHKLFKIHSQNIYDEVALVCGDFLIVDEASLIDESTAYKLFKGLSPYTQLVILGDANQLPSVGPGQVFRDMIDSGHITVTNLTHIFRQNEDSHIVFNAHKIINGNLLSSPIYISNQKGSDFYFFDCKEELLQETVGKIYMSLLGIYSVDNVQILSPSKNTPVGTTAINQLIQNLYVQNGVSVQSKKLEFFEKDKVIHTKNNYSLEVFNGETGEIKKINALEQTVTVDFGDREITYDKEALLDLDLAYDITIHKSQGSEFPVVIIPITQGNKNMLSKNLLYTAISRAKERVILVGDKKLFTESIKKEMTARRNSKLKELI